MERQHFVINNWIVKPELNRIEHGDSVVHLEPKIVDVLVYLARNAGRVVSRDELMDKVWEGTVVLPDSLNRCISQLRSVLEPTSVDGQVIETIRKRGYRLVAKVRFMQQLSGEMSHSMVPTYFNLPVYTVSSTMAGPFARKFRYV